LKKGARPSGTVKGKKTVGGNQERDTINKTGLLVVTKEPRQRENKKKLAKSGEKQGLGNLHAPVEKKSASLWKRCPKKKQA